MGVGMEAGFRLVFIAIMRIYAARLFMTVRARYLVAVVLWLASSAFAQEASPPTAMGAKKFANIIDIAPWGLAGSDGQPKGVYTAIFKRLSERTGCALEPRLTPIPRAVLEVSRGTASATIMMDRADLNENAVVIGEVTTLRIEMWLPPGSPARSLEDLAGKRVGYLRGPSYHEGFDRDANIVKHQVTSPRQQLEMLRKGRLDGAIGVRENFLFAAVRIKISPTDFPPPIDLGKRVVKLWVTPGLRDTPCAEQLRLALKDMRRDGEINRLISEASSASQ